MIKKANHILKCLINSKVHPLDKKNYHFFSIFYSLIGNMYYISKDYNVSAGYFIKSVSYSPDDINPWCELIFSLRAIGEFKIFEDIIFNLKHIIQISSSIEPLKFNQDYLIKTVKNINKLP